MECKFSREFGDRGRGGVEVGGLGGWGGGVSCASNNSFRLINVHIHKPGGTIERKTNKQTKNTSESHV